MSFVEVLVVVTIVMIISTSWFLYLTKLLWTTELKSELETFTVFLDNLYQEVRLGKRLSYEVNFGLSGGYTYYLDANSDKYAIFQTSNFDTGVFVLSSVWASSESWTLDLYSNDKKKSSELYLSTSTPSVTLKTTKDNVYKSYFTWEFSNELWASYFSDDNVGTNQDRYTKIVAINAQPDRAGTVYTSLKIVNKNGNRKLYSGTTQLTWAYVFFQKGEQELSIFLSP